MQANITFNTVYIYIYIYIYIKFRYDNVDTNIKDLCNKMT